MLISEVIHLVRKLYIDFNQAEFHHNIGPESHWLWLMCGCNVNTFLEKIKPEYREKFNNWIKVDQEQLDEMNAVMSLIYTKNASLPGELRTIYCGVNSVPLFITSLGCGSLEKLTQWAEENIIQAEIDFARAMRLNNFADEKPVKNMHRPELNKYINPAPSFAVTNSRNFALSHRNASMIVGDIPQVVAAPVPVSAPPPSQNYSGGMRMSQNSAKASPLPSSSGSKVGVRNIEQLRKSFGEI